MQTFRQSRLRAVLLINDVHRAGVGNVRTLWPNICGAEKEVGVSMDRWGFS